MAAPSPGQLGRLAQTWGSEIQLATAGTPISPALVLAVMSVESGGNPKALSPASARGLMQLMPATAARFDVRDSYDSDQNIRGAVAYLAWLMQKFDNDPLRALAGYNARENRVLSSDGVPVINETRDYVPKVLAAWQVARGLCLNPPV